ncbi:aa3-type cytochrome c oxidase subunit IV [Phenylobacterium aquaticum]|uniref:aa3-type cytochrome c oxidase subunit IV n=1 Tax=Phenylobacterium aquaticum TaxID=1763816 RepID=UPI001F5D6977|nr:aa3-type cytochrome c oxidase subunit IV [Phenylobacterium aquaticum]MCI3131830.1 aa3-type cytochrome c oxidase subunit IV [Phenylobacterium aquaticum]
MASEFHRGEMDISEQVATFHLFNGMTKWGSLALAALLTLLVLWFCTPAGFLAGFVSAAVLVVIGVIVLREKPEAAH